MDMETVGTLALLQQELRYVGVGVAAGTAAIRPAAGGG